MHSIGNDFRVFDPIAFATTPLALDRFIFQINPDNVPIFIRTEIFRENVNRVEEILFRHAKAVPFQARASDIQPMHRNQDRNTPIGHCLSDRLNHGHVVFSIDGTVCIDVDKISTWDGVLEDVPDIEREPDTIEFVASQERHKFIDCRAVLIILP